MTLYDPEPLKRYGQTRAKLDMTLRTYAPSQHSPQIAMFDRETPQPYLWLGPDQLRRGPLSKRHVVVGVPASQNRGLAVGLQLLQRVLTDRLQHYKAWLVSGILLLEQTLV